jgi:hypothetical protein
MAKLGKIKLNLLGEVRGRTTDKGDIELFLYYDVENNYFYFDDKELKLLFKKGEYYFNFNDCVTKEMAIRLVKEHLFASTEKTRMLSLKIRVTAELGKLNEKKFPEYLKGKCNINSIEDYEDNGISLEIGFKRVMRLGHEGEYLYINCDENWNYKKSYGRYEYHHHELSLIEWDEQTELFLLNMQKQMNNLCKNVVDFFNAPDANALKQKINNSPLMIGQK